MTVSVALLPFVLPSSRLGWNVSDRWWYCDADRCDVSAIVLVPRACAKRGKPDGILVTYDHCFRTFKKDIIDHRKAIVAVSPGDDGPRAGEAPVVVCSRCSVPATNNNNVLVALTAVADCHHAIDRAEPAPFVCWHRHRAESLQQSYWGCECAPSLAVQTYRVSVTKRLRVSTMAYGPRM